MYDFHVHSNFSGDCEYSMEEMVKGAIKNNIKMMSFTDHMDHDYGNCEVDFIFEVEDYLKHFNKVKDSFKNDIELLTGVEIGMQPHLVTKIYDLMPLDVFDFIIMSIHTAKGSELHEGDFYKNKSASKAYADYYEDLYTCVSNFDNFDIVGHVNIIDRYTNFLKNPEIEFNEYKDLLIEVLKKIISKDKGIEVNTSGIRYGLGAFHPNVEILKLYKQLGGEIITFGSDSHTPKDLGFMYADVLNLLRDLDFKYITTFKERKHNFIKI
ncbi:histidinol-phosphatase HisK [Gottschalkia acidurici 9a]|uniref:Histidinol-phosphatase n=1 Tax=Gottschalkia acidurici (strain ATCC 7906 / DSM 604 / BCRC 14475 / CIP 104303 / KCTC 5404 / NCIMB 10678 / 9a) TaxID=1128398 RepID=K0AVV1_GOTA9|nr:histidinol-phosphatase HisJ family protein [Gottschalkia acidurici]AFS77993.1 histidinol-phosphatase HisK [Gottschalkia acidurici 9a]